MREIFITTNSLSLKCPQDVRTCAVKLVLFYFKKYVSYFLLFENQ